MTQHGATFGGTVKQKYISHIILSILPNVQVQVWERHGHQGLQQLAVCRSSHTSVQSSRAVSYFYCCKTEEASKLQGGGVVLKARPLQLGCYRSDKTEKKRGIGHRTNKIPRPGSGAATSQYKYTRAF